MNDWVGLSGAPVFIGSKLYGVIRTKYKSVDPKEGSAEQIEQAMLTG